MTIGLIRSRGWEVGGAFQYDRLILDTLSANLDGLPDDIIYLSPPSDAIKALVRLDTLSYSGIPIRAFEEESFVQKPVEAYLGSPPAFLTNVTSALPPVNKGLLQRLRELDVDWMFLLEPTLWGIECRTPFIMPIHDLQHRQQPHFSELTHSGEFVRREQLYKNACRYATMIIVDSPVGREDVLNAYGDVVEPERIRILPFIAGLSKFNQEENEARITSVQKIYGLPEKFLFYPAQFWAHKNHAAVLLAMEILKREQGLDVHLVLSGSYASHHGATVFQTLRQIADALGLADKMHYVGFVSDAHMRLLYASACALVMPTYFGPTNLPVVEAWDLGCPVITSRIRGITEMVGDAGLLAAPEDPRDLAEAIKKVWTDEMFRQELIHRGRQKTAQRSNTVFQATLFELIADTHDIVKSGRSPVFPAG